MRLSIVVVTWNCRKYVQEFFGSLAYLFNDPSVEIIVADNASTDGTPELIAQSFPSINLIRNSGNLGFAKGNNIALERCSGEYIALINPDVKVLPGCIERMMETLQSHPDIGLLGPRMLERDALVHRSTMRFPTVWNCFCNAVALDIVFSRFRFFSGYLMRDFQFDKTTEVEILNGWFWMTRRKALLEVGGLDERFFMYGEDMDWSRRFKNAKWKNVYLAEASSIHYGGGSSSNSPVRFYIEKHRANFQYFEKHHNPFEQAGFWISVFLYHFFRVLGHGVRYVLPGSNRQERGYKVKRSMACLRWLVGFMPDTDVRSS